jgi:hypothetical protein
MKVFISWSGKRSETAALALRDWLPCVLQSTLPFVSSEDLRKGKRWLIELSTELQATTFGIICLYPDNIHSSWINFEAGALSKSLKESSTCTLLLGGLSPTDVEGPLSMFQHTVFSKPDILKLIHAINRASEHPVDEARLVVVFEKFWPDLNASIGAANSSGAEIGREIRKDRDLLEEILGLSRFIAKALDSERDHEISSEIEKLRKLLSMDISEIEMDSRIVKILKSQGLNTVGVLTQAIEGHLRKVAGISKADIDSIKSRLDDLGLSLGMRFDARLLEPK